MMLGFAVDISWCYSNYDFQMQQQTQALQDIADAQQAQAYNSDPIPVVVNAAGEGCRWVQLVDKEDNNLYYCDHGCHKLYIKKCDNDPDRVAFDQERNLVP